jgi:Enolase C-terminal domain-like
MGPPGAWLGHPDPGAAPDLPHCDRKDHVFAVWRAMTLAGEGRGDFVIGEAIAGEIKYTITHFRPSRELEDGAWAKIHQHSGPEFVSRAMVRRYWRGKEDRDPGGILGPPVAPHDCTGPIVLTASMHLSLNAPNTLVQETVRAFTHGWYREAVTELPDIRDGYVYPSMAPGLGTRLRPDRFSAADCGRRVTRIGDL